VRGYRCAAVGRLQAVAKMFSTQMPVRVHCCRPARQLAVAREFSADGASNREMSVDVWFVQNMVLRATSVHASSTKQPRCGTARASRDAMPAGEGQREEEDAVLLAMSRRCGKILCAVEDARATVARDHNSQSAGTQAGGRLAEPLVRDCCRRAGGGS